MPGTREDQQRALLYRLPHTDGTVWLGLPLSSLLVLGSTLGLTVALVMAGAPLTLAVAVLLLAGVVALAPLCGRTLLGWTGPAVRYTAQVLAGRGWTRTTAVADPAPASGRGLRLPPECGRIHVATVDGDDPASYPMAVLRHQPARRRAGAARTLTLLFEVQHLAGVALLDPDGHDLRLAGWGSSLDALAADPRVHSLQWLTHTRPDTRDHQSSWPEARDEPDDAGRGRKAGDGRLEALRRDHDQLVHDASHRALSHQHLLIVNLSANVNRKVRAGRTEDHDATGVSELARDLASLLLTADLLARPVAAEEIGPLLRRLVDPALLNLPLLGSDSATSGDRWGIGCRRSGWDHTRTDDSWHRSYTVADWPRLPLTGDWLAPLLATPPTDGTSRTLAVHVTPVAPLHAVRQARAAAAKAQLDATDRGRLGLHPSASAGSPAVVDERAAQDAAELEAELAAGFRLFRIRAVITVTAPGPALLRSATHALRATAATSRLDLRPLHGQHAHGLVATLPLGLLPGASR